MADLKTLAGGAQYARPGSPVEARQEEVAREYLQRAEEGKGADLRHPS